MMQGSQTQFFVARISNGGALHPGRVVVVEDIGPRHPVPTFVTDCCERSATPLPTAGAFLVNAKSYAEAEVLPTPAAPPPDLKREDVRQLLQCDDESVNLAMAALKFPPATLRHQTDAWGNPRGSYERWNGREIQQWFALVDRFFPTARKAR